MLEQLAEEIDANRPTSPNPGYPAWLREKVVAATIEVLASGGTLRGTVSKLGLNPYTLHRWTHEASERKVTFRPVRIADAVSEPTRRYRLRAPSGYEVDDLTLPDIIALLRELA